MTIKLPYSWPLGLDVLKRQYDANVDQRLMAFQTQFFEEHGANMEIRLLGNVGYMTIDPKNIEAILSSRFDGMNSLRGIATKNITGGSSDH